MEYFKSKKASVEYSILKQEDGIPIYQTPKNPIQYETKQLNITKQPVVGVNGAFLLSNVLTDSECQQFIDITSTMGFEDATVTTGMGMVMAKDIRDNKRVMWQTSDDIWQPIWERIKALMPTEGIMFRREQWYPSSLNERLRFYKYEPGQIFQRHYDGYFPRSDKEVSLLTCIIYLNDGFEGGHTTFFPDQRREIKVNPVQGQALLFWHGPTPLSPLHEGSFCLNGSKYVLRTDVMFRPASSQ